MGIIRDPEYELLSLGKHFASFKLIGKSAITKARDLATSFSKDLFESDETYCDPICTKEEFEKLEKRLEDIKAKYEELERDTIDLYGKLLDYKNQLKIEIIEYKHESSQSKVYPYGNNLLNVSESSESNT